MSYGYQFYNFMPPFFPNDHIDLTDFLTFYPPDLLAAMNSLNFLIL